MKEDIENSVSHVFGSHENCRDYFCERKDERNYLTDILNTSFYDKIKQHNRIMSNNARSLILDVDSNAVEQFNAIVAKFVGGKRINFSLNRSYEARCSAAVVSFNCKRPHYALHKALANKSPGKHAKQLELRRIKHNTQNILRRKLRLKSSTKVQKAKEDGNSEPDYGENCQQPDISEEELEKAKKEFLKHLKKTDEERIKIEKETILQGKSGKWIEERRKLLTASNFHRICRKRPSTSCQNIVRSLLYDHKNLNVSSIIHGRTHEEDARRKLEEHLGINISPCGLFIHKLIPFLGNSEINA